MDKDLFYKLFDQQRNKLFRFAHRILNDTAQAEDVVQESFIKLWNNAEYWGSYRNPEAVIVTICKNLSLDKLKSKYRRTDPLDKVHQLHNTQPDPAELAERNDRLSQVKRMIQDLPEEQRMILHLRDIEGMTYQEIAECCETSLSSVKSIIHRARKKIREQILANDAYGISRNK